MYRQSVAFLIAIYAIGFAFVALAALRWPSLLMIGAAFAYTGSPLTELPIAVSWREIGLIYGTPYFFAALLFYASSTLVQRKGRGAIVTFLLGVGVGFPPFLIFDFQPGWWGEPSLFESVMLIAAAITSLLLLMIWQLRWQSPKPASPLVLSNAIVRIPEGRPVMTVDSHTPSAEAPVARRRRAVAPAIARQRASFAAHGRRQLARAASRA
ncbi:MAG: hypothetical protein AAF950_14950 [Pseudomonadota bacterium]